MGNAKELFEKLNRDPAFANEVADRLDAKKEAGAQDVIEASVEVAKELGYDLTKEDIEAFAKPAQKELSADDLDEVAGGYVYEMTDNCGNYINSEVINDQTGNVMGNNYKSLEEAKRAAQEMGQSTELINWNKIDSLRKSNNS